MIIVIFSVLLFGCLGEGPQQEPTGAPEENESKEPGPVLVIEDQENETAEEQEEGAEPEEQEEGAEPKEEPGIEYTQEPKETFTIYFIDLSWTSSEVQGESILIKKGDFEMLVDAGPSETSNRVIDFLKTKEVDDIDVFMLTSDDPGHYGGISAITSEFHIEEFWWAGGSTFGDQGYGQAIETASQKAEETLEIEEGYDRTLNGFDFTILNPPTGRYSDRNNDAIVTHINDRNFSMLLMSGIQTGPQHRMINEYKEETKVDVLQAPYYGLGSGTAQFGIFLQTSTPESCVITGSSDDSETSGGSRDPFLRYLEQYEVPSYKTYVGGTVQITSNGQGFSIRHMD